MEAIVNEGQACRKCGTAVVKVSPKGRSPKRAYWYEWYLRCPKCGNMYMVESTKVINPHYKGGKRKVEKPVERQEDRSFTRYVQALDRIAYAPKMATADTMRAIAKQALDGVNFQDIHRQNLGKVVSGRMEMDQGFRRNMMGG